MPGQVRPVADERDGLLSYLAQMRSVITLAAYGLTDEQARATPSASPLSVGGLIKHVASVESGWIDTVLQVPATASPSDYEDNFRMREDETLADVVAGYEKVAARTAEVLAGIADLNQPVPVPKGVPWFPQDIDAWSVRWVLLHLIQETARHAGHADIVREHVDGATAYPLMAAAESWPETPWMKPWSPATQPA
jgi:uncharacterized damage-inducible protein DinB